jgi:GT2 family glycosyltransferase
MKNRICVIILSYFRHKDTYSSIESVKKSLPATVFLVDNSSDKIERDIIKKMFKNKKDVHLIFPEKNLGFSAGVNLALKHAIDAGFCRFLLLNNDAVLLKGAGQTFDRAFNQYPGSLIAPAIKWNMEICDKSYYHKYFGLIYRKQPDQKSGWLPYFTGCALAFDLTAVKTLGYFCDIFFMYGEDIEICYRAQTKGIPMVLLKEVLVYHKGSLSAQMNSFFYEYHIARAHYLLSFYTLDHPIKTFLSLLGKSITLTVRACIRSIRHHNLNAFAALLLAPMPLKVRPRR